MAQISSIEFNYENSNISTTNTIDNSVSTQCEKSTNNRCTLIFVTAKLSVLISIAMIITIVSIISIFIAVVINNSVYVFIFSMLLTSMDITVNSLCLLLQWPFTQNLYQILCKRCQSCMFRLFAHEVEHYLQGLQNTDQTNKSIVTVDMKN